MVYVRCPQRASLHVAAQEGGGAPPLLLEAAARSACPHAACHCPCCLLMFLSLHILLFLLRCFFHSIAPLPHVAAPHCSLILPTRAALQVYNSYRFGFDRVYGTESTQEEVYVQSARSAVQNVLQVRCWVERCLPGHSRTRQAAVAANRQEGQLWGAASC